MENDNAGWVYFVEADFKEVDPDKHRIKVGKSKTPNDRMSTVFDYSPVQLYGVVKHPDNNYSMRETWIKYCLQKYHVKNEWHDIPPWLYNEIAKGNASRTFDAIGQGLSGLKFEDFCRSNTHGKKLN